MKQKKDDIMTICCLCPFEKIEEITCNICDKANANDHKAVYKIVLYSRPIDTKAIIKIANTKPINQ